MSKFSLGAPYASPVLLFVISTMSIVASATLYGKLLVFLLSSLIFLSSWLWSWWRKLIPYVGRKLGKTDMAFYAALLVGQVVVLIIVKKSFPNAPHMSPQEALLSPNINLTGNALNAGASDTLVSIPESTSRADSSIISVFPEARVKNDTIDVRREIHEPLEPDPAPNIVSELTPQHSNNQLSRKRINDNQMSEIDDKSVVFSADQAVDEDELQEVTQVDEKNVAASESVTSFTQHEPTSMQSPDTLSIASTNEEKLVPSPNLLEFQVASDNETVPDDIQSINTEQEDKSCLKDLDGSSVEPSFDDSKHCEPIAQETLLTDPMNVFCSKVDAEHNTIETIAKKDPRPSSSSVDISKILSLSPIPSGKKKHRKNTSKENKKEKSKLFHPSAYSAAMHAEGSKFRNIMTKRHALPFNKPQPGLQQRINPFFKTRLQRPQLAGQFPWRAAAFRLLRRR